MCAVVFSALVVKSVIGFHGGRWRWMTEQHRGKSREPGTPASRVVPRRRRCNSESSVCSNGSSSHTRSGIRRRNTENMYCAHHEELHDDYNKNNNNNENDPSEDTNSESSSNDDIPRGLGALTKESIKMASDVLNLPNGFNVPGMDMRYVSGECPPPESNVTESHMAMTYEKWLLLNKLNSDDLGINTKIDEIKKNDHIFPESMAPDLTAGGLMSDWNEEFQKEKESES